MDFKPDSIASTFQLPFGANPESDGLTRFRVWAPKAKKLQLQIVERNRKQESFVKAHELERDQHGVFSGLIEDCPPNTLYRLHLDHGPGRPDPYSRFQPFGVHGPSQVIDPTSFEWSDELFNGVAKRDLVIYELHVGSFTKQGTYQAATEQLDELIELGVNAIELLPLAQTPGRWNWGYDGVNFFAPRNTFGRPDELKAFINACHRKGIAVILDVVYNHVGPEGNYLNEFGPYRSKKFGTPWGDSLNFCGPGCELVREFVISNVLFWIDEYHFDGLRLDAIHYMFDGSDGSIVNEIRARFNEYAKTVDRTLHLIAEANIYDADLVGDPANGNCHYDAIWSDCLMHSIYAHGCPDVRLTNRNYRAKDLTLALQHAYVFSAPQAVRVDPKQRKLNHPDGDRRYIESLILALQTHDSVGNHPHGKRLHQLTCLEFQKAAAPLILLYPSIPMIFMGEEWATEAPFPFFADFEDRGLRVAVDQGRRDEYPHHDWSGSPLPSERKAFLNSKSKPSDQNVEMRNWYRALLELRKQGLAEGWLNVDSMKAEFFFADDRFALVYQTPNQRITVCSRLAKQDADSILHPTTESAKLLLESVDGINQSASSALEFRPRHCCIWIEG